MSKSFFTGILVASIFAISVATGFGESINQTEAQSNSTLDCRFGDQAAPPTMFPGHLNACLRTGGPDGECTGYEPYTNRNLPEGCKLGFHNPEVVTPPQGGEIDEIP